MIYRAPLRDGFALAHNLVGIRSGPERRVQRFADVPDGGFVWTRDAHGQYWLGRIEGSCRDLDSPATDLRHVRPTRWQDRPVAPDRVPAAVIATFARGGQNFQRTHDARAEEQTAELWSAG